MTTQSKAPASVSGHPFICVAAFSVLYGGLLFATGEWHFYEGGALFRPGYGLCVAAMLLMTRRCLPLIVIVAAALGASYASLSGIDAGQMLLLTIGDPLSALLTAGLAAKLTRGRIDIGRPASMAALCAVFLLVPVAQATLAASVAPVMQSWAGISLATLLIVPFAATWLNPSPAAATPRPQHVAQRCVEALAAVLLPAACVLAIGLSAPPIVVAVPGIVLTVMLLLWGSLRRQPRVTTAALLVSGGLAAWHLAAKGSQAEGLADLDIAAAIIFPVVAATVLLVSSVLLELTRQRDLTARVLGLVASAQNHLDRRFALPLEERITNVLGDAADYLDASDFALYMRAADSSLFRRAQRHQGGDATLPDALLARQLQTAGGEEDASTIVQDLPAGMFVTLSSARTTVAVRRLTADGGEALLVAAWQRTVTGKSDAAAPLMRLLLPACCAAIDQSRAAAEQKHAQALFGLVLAGVPDAVCLALADGTLLDANKAFETLTGYLREELRGRSFVELALFDQGSQDAALAAAPVGSPSQHRRFLHNKSGVRLQCDLHLLRLSGDHDAPILLLARQNIAGADRQQQQKNLERQLSQAQRMEAIGQLTQGVAHDFNNILGSIMGYTSLARLQGPVREDKKLSGYLSEIETAGKRATVLIQQMLTFSRRGRRNPVAVRVSEVLGRVIGFMPSLLPERIDARTEISQNLPALIVDVAQFEQAVVSLAVNARDALVARGTITLGARRFSAAAATCSSCRKPIEGDCVAIYVADTGTGIAPEVMDRLFEPFFTTKEVGRGTGLGLSGVHGFVHNHDGHIVVTSEPGIGSEFSLILPVQSDSVEGPAIRQQPLSPPSSRKPHVLLVDDQQALASLMKQVLETRDFVVTAETDGQAARERFESDPDAFDVVVTDRVMPGLDGLALARAVQAARPDIPVVLCTGLAATVSDADVAAAGIQRVFRKPLRVMEFAQELEALLPSTATGATPRVENERLD